MAWRGPTVGGIPYKILQFHFHTPAEHPLQGREFPAELHFVHRGPAGQLTVVGVLVEVGRENPILDNIWDELPRTKGEEKQAAACGAGRYHHSFFLNRQRRAPRVGLGRRSAAELRFFHLPTVLG